MTIEDRIAGIGRENKETRNALKAAGLMEPSPLPDITKVREAMARGDNDLLGEFPAAARRRGNFTDTLREAGLLGGNRRRRQ